MIHEARQEIAQLRRQRNVLAGVVCSLVMANLFLAMKLSTAEERVIMVPGIDQEMRIDGMRVSESYLEEASLLYLSALLDLTPTTVRAKEEVILRHISPKDPKNIIKMKKYFADAVENHQKFQLSTFFTLDEMHISPQNLEVIASGTVSSTFGKRGGDQQKVKYMLSFDLIGGLLKLRNFEQVK